MIFIIPEGISDESKISCTITYESKVVNPRKTIIDYQLNTKVTIFQTITLTLEETLKDILEDKLHNTSADLTLSNDTSFNRTAVPTAVTLVGSNLDFTNIISSASPTAVPSLKNIFFPDNAWSKKTLENIVSIPESTQTKSNFSIIRKQGFFYPNSIVLF